MRLLIFSFAVLVAAMVLTQVALQDPGYVLITRKPWSVETSLSFFAVLLTLTFALLYLLTRLLVRAWQMPADISTWQRQRRVKRAHQSQAQGIIYLVQREWDQAEKHLLARLHDCDTPVINYLGAAIAAQHQGDLEQRDKYLSLAHESAPKETLAIELTQAELQRDSAQAERALATLSHLQSVTPKNIHVLRLLIEVYRGLRDWRGLAVLLSTLRKRKVMSNDQLDTLELETYSELLSVTATDEDTDILKEVWEQAVPKHLRKNPALVAVYARQLLTANAMEACESVLRTTLKHIWDSTLVYLYGRVQLKDTTAQFKTVEEWLQKHPMDPQLLLSAGRLAIRNKIWGSARSYLEASIANGGPREAYLELGYLLEQLGEKDNALEYYRQGLELTAQSKLPADGSGQQTPTPLTG